MRQYLALLAASVICCAAFGQTVPDRSAVFPPDWTPQTLLDSELTPGWFPPADDAHAPGAFEFLEVSHSLDARARGRASCRWEFQTLPEGPSDNVLMAATAPPARFHALSLWVKNPTGRQAPFHLALRDADDALYLFPPTQLGEELNWHELAFFVKDSRLAPGTLDPNPGIQFPARSISAHLGDLNPHLRYVLFLDELRWHVAPPVNLDVVELTSPGTLEAGETAAVRFRLRAQSELSGPLALTVSLVREGGAVCSRVAHQPVPDECAAGSILAPVEVSLGVPAYAVPGEYRIDIRSDDARIMIPDPTRLPTGLLRVTRSEEQSTEASVRISAAGEPELIVRGKLARLLVVVPRPRDIGEGPAPDPAAEVVRFPVCIGEPQAGCPALAWREPGEFGLEAIYETCARLLSVMPRALLIPEVRISAPDWWMDRNSRELVTVSVDGDAFNRIRQPSFASDKWRQDAGEALGALVSGLEGSAFADHIAGYELSAGEGGCWASWDLRESSCAGYEGPQKRAFQQWLSARYGSLENLRGAWNQPLRPTDRPGAARAVMTWGEVDVPAPALRKFTGAWILDPAVFQPVVDYRLASSEITAAAIEHFAGIVGEKCGGRKVCGVHYGQVLDLGRSQEKLAESGLLAFGKVLRSEKIHFVSGAYPCPWASVSRAGKLHLPDITTAWNGRAQGQARELRQSATLTVAAGGQAITRRDLEGLSTGRSVSEIAVIVDEESAAYLSAGGPVGTALMGRQLEQIACLGAPADIWLQRDFAAQAMPQYRMTVFLNAFRAADAELRLALAGRFRPEDVVVWLGAPGAVGASLNGRSMKDLTGITTALGMGSGALDVRVAGGGALTAGVRPGTSYGLKSALPPWFQVIDRNVDVLGTDPSDRPALVATRRDGHWSVYSATPGLPADLLRSFAQSAGVHLYAPSGDRVEASSTFVAVTAGSSGARIIRLPGPADVWELGSEQQVAAGTTQITGMFQGGQTRCYRVVAQ